MLVKFKEVLDPSDADNIMEVLEDRGDRYLVRSINYCVDWVIRPTTMVEKEDVEEATE